MHSKIKARLALAKKKLLSHKTRMAFVQARRMAVVIVSAALLIAIVATLALSLRPGYPDEELAAVSYSISEIETGLKETFSYLEILEEAVVESQELAETKNEIILGSISDGNNALNASLAGNMASINDYLDELQAQIRLAKNETSSLIVGFKEISSTDSSNIASAIVSSFGGLKMQLNSINGLYALLMEEITSSHSAAMKMASEQNAELGSLLGEIFLRLSDGSSDLTDLASQLYSRMDENYSDLALMLGQLAMSLGEASSENLLQAISHIEQLELSTYGHLFNYHGQVMDGLSLMGDNHLYLLQKLSEARDAADSSRADMVNHLSLQAAQASDDISLVLAALSAGFGQAEATAHETIKDQNILLAAEIGTNADSILTQMSAGFLDAGQATKNMIADSDGYLSGEIRQAGDALSSIIDELGIRLSGMESSVNSNLSTLFQFVSNGKTLLAAALLTRGQTVANDANFIDFHNAILSIENTVMIENMPGEIEYVFHYHTSADGGDTATVNPQSLDGHENAQAVPSGCFTAPSFHQHRDGDGNARDENYLAPGPGGCFGHHDFSANTSHSHAVGGCTLRGPCPICPGGNCGHPQAFTHHVHCNRPAGQCNDSIQCGGGSYRCNNLPLNTGGWAHWTLDCGKTAESIDAHGLGCGFIWGQIAKAVISY
ncbi:MAG: hypothetical protein FWG91_03880 [Lachnospiraceae bacterium]|nr:hypothetical protein [Lachnospiraceae bacterium]